MHVHTHTGPFSPSSSHIQLCIPLLDSCGKSKAGLFGGNRQGISSSSSLRGNAISNLWTQWTKHRLKPVDTVNKTLSQTCGHSEQNTVSNLWPQWMKHYLKPVDTVNKTLCPQVWDSERNTISNLWIQWTKHYLKHVDTVNQMLSQTCGHSERNTISNLWTQWMKHYSKPVDTVNKMLSHTLIQRFWNHVVVSCIRCRCR